MAEALNQFIPSAASGLRARSAIHARLNESLRHVFEQCTGHVEFDSARAAVLVRRTETGERLPPTLFGHYFMLVDAIENGTLKQVQDTLETILQHANGVPAPDMHIRPFNPRGFSAEEEAEFRRQFVSDSLLDEQISHLDENSEPGTLAQFQRALDILQRHAPQTFAEIDTLACELVPALGNAVNGMAFDGCSSLERWGSILLNAKPSRTDLELSEAITHESAHNALFAMAPVNFHVENDPQELYQSPLRLDPRPMNGIYHATFVLARMCFAMGEVATSPTADAALCEEARALARHSAKLFADGYRVLEKHADYTAEGRAIMQDAARYMARQAS
jgi:hypothetical protein